MDPDTMRFLAPHLALSAIKQTCPDHRRARTATLLAARRLLTAVVERIQHQHDRGTGVEQRTAPSRPGVLP